MSLYHCSLVLQLAFAYTMFLEQPRKECAHGIGNPRTDKFVCSEAIDFIPQKPQIPVGSDHLRIGGERWSVVVAEMVFAVDLDHYAGTLWKQEQEVHALPREKVALSRRRATNGRIVVEIALRNESWKSISEHSAKASKKLIEQRALRIGSKRIAKPATQAPASGLFGRAVRAMRFDPPCHKIGPQQPIPLKWPVAYKVALSV